MYMSSITQTGQIVLRNRNYITAINEKWALNLKRARRGMWEGSEGGKGKGMS